MSLPFQSKIHLLRGWNTMQNNESQWRRRILGWLIVIVFCLRWDQEFFLPSLKKDPNAFLAFAAWVSFVCCFFLDNLSWDFLINLFEELSVASFLRVVMHSLQKWDIPFENMLVFFNLFSRCFFFSLLQLEILTQYSFLKIYLLVLRFLPTFFKWSFLYVYIYIYRCIGSSVFNFWNMHFLKYLLRLICVVALYPF